MDCERVNPSFGKIRILVTLVTFSSLLLLSDCQKDNIPPIAVISAFPLVGDSTMQIEFNGNKSSDNSTYLKGLLFSWDFESDGNWDIMNSTNAINTNKFTKPGSYNVCMSVQDNAGLHDYDTISIIIVPANTKTGHLFDERAGNSYTTVFLSNDWWMAENLKYGELIKSTQEQVNNQTVEKYYYLDDSVIYSGFGGLYKCDESINYNTDPRGICPGGWHLPDSKEWQSLLNNIDPWYAWQFFGAQGLSGLKRDDLDNFMSRFNFDYRLLGTSDVQIKWSLMKKLDVFFFRIDSFGNITFFAKPELKDDDLLTLQSICYRRISD